MENKINAIQERLMTSNSDESDEKVKQVIKDTYKTMLDIFKLNEPEVYCMPVSVYNEIMKKVVYLESALVDARKSRDNWKKEYSLRNADAKDYSKRITKLEKELKNDKV